MMELSDYGTHPNDSCGGNLAGHFTRRRDDWVWTVATVNYIDRPPLLATAGIGSTVHLWQSAWSDWIRARTFGRPLSGQGYGIGVLASMPTADGGAMLASADEDGFAKCWTVPNSERPKSNWWTRPLAQPMTQDRDSLSSRIWPHAGVASLLCWRWRCQAVT